MPGGLQSRGHRAAELSGCASAVNDGWNRGLAEIMETCRSRGGRFVRRCTRGCSAPIPSTKLDSRRAAATRSEEHTSELQSLMRTSYSVFCFKKKNYVNQTSDSKHHHHKY